MKGCWENGRKTHGMDSVSKGGGWTTKNKPRGKVARAASSTVIDRGGGILSGNNGKISALKRRRNDFIRFERFSFLSPERQRGFIQ